MRRLFRRPRLVAAAVVAIALAAFVAVNAVDEELRPEARALFAPPAMPFARDSGWALIAGFNAPVAEDPRAYAETLRRAGSTRVRGRSPGRVAAEIDIRAATELLCSPESADCTRAFAQRPDSIGELASDNAVLLARYDELLKTTQLGDVTEALDYYGSIGYFNTVLRTQVVRLSQVGAAAGTGRMDEAIAWLEADAVFYRRWLAEAGSILSKMIAVRGFTRDLLLAGQIARSGRTLSASQWEALERMAAPLSESERGVAHVIGSESALFAGVLDHMVADPKATSEVIDAPRLMGTLVAATVRRNATLNFAQPLFAEWMRLDAVPSDALAPAIEETRARTRRFVEADWTWAYNFIGKSVAAEQAPDLAEYVYRVRDIDALAATIRCVIALRRQGIDAGAAGAFVAGSAACRDPYGGQLAWVADTGALSFKPRSPGQVKRLGGTGDRVIFAAYPR